MVKLTAFEWVKEVWMPDPFIFSPHGEVPARSDQLLKI